MRMSLCNFSKKSRSRWTVVVAVSVRSSQTDRDVSVGYMEILAGKRVYNFEK
jgi:hypothetical protein